jgi:hypothetical protein
MKNLNIINSELSYYLEGLIEGDGTTLRLKSFEYFY